VHSSRADSTALSRIPFSPLSLASLCRFGTNLAAALLIWFFCYESKGLSLEAVDTMYSEKGLKPWHSAKWVPAGYTDRKNRDEQYWIEHANVKGNGSGSGEVKTTPTRLSDD
jgi:SP family sugar:H+ symporter-like MFS transporter